MSRRSEPPSAAIEKRSSPCPRLDEKASLLPSGDQAWTQFPDVRVTRAGSPPAAGTFQIGPAVKASVLPSGETA